MIFSLRHVFIFVASAASGICQLLECSPEFTGYMTSRPGVPKESVEAAEKLASNTFRSIELAMMLDFGYFFSFANHAVTVPKKDIDGYSFHRFTLPGTLGGFFNSSMKAIELIPRILHNNTDPSLASTHMNRSAAESDPWWAAQDAYKAWHAGARGDDSYVFIQVVNGARVPREEAFEYYPVQYVEPIIGNEAAAGFDLGSSAVRLHAIKTAEASFGRVVSARIRLTQSLYEQYGFLMFYPLFQNRSHPGWFTTGSRSPASAEALWPSALVLGVYVVEELLGKAVKSAPFTSQAGASFLIMVFQKLGYPNIDPLQPNAWEYMAGFSSMLDADNATAMAAFNIDWKERREKNLEIVAHSVLCARFPIDDVGSEWRVVFAVDYGCQEGEFLVEEGFPGKRLNRCQQCSEGMICSGRASQASLEIAPGFWARRSGAVASVYKCAPAAACPGGAMEEGVAPCAGGRAGFMCSQCPHGWFPDEEECTQCDLAAVASVAFAMVMLLVIPAALLRQMWKFRLVSQSPHKLTALLLLGQVCTALQVLLALTKAGLNWGSPFVDLLGLLSISIDFNTVKLHCMGTSNAAVQYSLRMGSPLMLIAILSAAFVVIRSAKPGALRRDGVLNAAGTILLVVFITLTLASMTPFQCYEHPNGEASVKLHPEVICYATGEHQGMVAVAVAATLIYLIGTISMVVYATRRYPMEMLKADTGFVQRFYFLFNRWRPECYWLSSVLVSRNFCLAVFPMVIPARHADVSVVLFYVTLLTTFFFTVYFQPWRTSLLNQVDIAVHASLLVVVMVGSLTVYGNKISHGLSVLLLLIVVACFMACLIAVLVKVLAVLLGTRRYTAFLSHHKGSAQCMARLFKTYLAKLLSGPIFFDADNLQALGDLLSEVKQSAAVIVLLTSETLSRPWCVGEVVTAYACSIPVLPVGMCTKDEGTKNPLRTSFESRAQFNEDFEVLRPFGISMADIPPAIEKLLEEDIQWCRPSDLSETCSVLEDIAARLGLKQSKSLVGRDDFVDAPKDAKVLIVADRSDGEALAAQMTLKIMLQAKLQMPVAIDAALSDSSFEDSIHREQPLVLVWQVTEGSWACLEQLQRLTLFYEMRPASAALPVMIGSSIFPDGAWYARMESAGALTAAVRSLLTSIAHRIDLGNSSLEILRPLVGKLTSSIVDRLDLEQQRGTDLKVHCV